MRAHTFLQYVCQRLLGNPVKVGAEAGDWYWRCPFHDDSTPSFHTMPHRDAVKDRYKCFGCGVLGDEADLMKELIPGETWTVRKARLEEWHKDWQHMEDVSGDKDKGTGSTGAVRLPAIVRAPMGDSTLLSFRGPRSQSATVEQAYQGLTSKQALILSAARHILLEHCPQDPLALLARSSEEGSDEDLLEFVYRTDEYELEHCDDPDCPADVCRIARGLDAYTIEERGVMCSQRRGRNKS